MQASPSGVEADARQGSAAHVSLATRALPFSSPAASNDVLPCVGKVQSTTGGEATQGKGRL